MEDRKYNLGTEADLAGYAEKFIEDEVLPLLRVKGQEYNAGGDSPAITNFLHGAEIARLSPERVLVTWASKQWGAVVRSTEGGIRDRSALRSRVVDIIVYLVILLFMMEGPREEPLTDEEMAEWLAASRQPRPNPRRG